MTRYYYTKDGTETEGPVSRQELDELRHSGQLPDMTRVRLMGSDRWQSLATVFEAQKSAAVSDESAEPSASARQTALKRAALIALIVGFVIAAILYRHTPEPTSDAGPLDLADSRKDLRQLELMTGKTGILGYQLSSWVEEQAPALVAVGVSCAVAAALFLARYSARRSDDE